MADQTLQNEKLEIAGVIDTLNLDPIIPNQESPNLFIEDGNAFKVDTPDHIMSVVNNETEARLKKENDFENYELSYNNLKVNEEGKFSVNSPVNVAEAWIMQQQRPEIFSATTGTDTQDISFEFKYGTTLTNYIKEEVEPDHRIRLFEVMKADQLKLIPRSQEKQVIDGGLHFASMQTGAEKINFFYNDGSVLAPSGLPLPEIFREAPTKTGIDGQSLKYIPYEDFIRGSIVANDQPDHAKITLHNAEPIHKIRGLDNEIDKTDRIIKSQGREVNILELDPKNNQVNIVGKDQNDKPVLTSIKNKSDLQDTLDNNKPKGFSFNIDKHSGFFSNFMANFTKNFEQGQKSKYVILPPDKTKDFINKIFSLSQSIFEKKDVDLKNNINNNTNMDSPKNTNHRFNYDQVDWTGIEQSTGVTPESLKKSGDLDRFLNGQKTSLIPHISGELKSKSGISIKMHQPAKIRLVDNGDGKLNLVIHGVRPQPDIRSEYLGYKFTDVDKYNLKNFGEMGKVVECTDIQTKEKYPSLIGIDPDTKEMVSMRAERMPKMIPDTLKGVILSDEQKKSLAEGKPTLIPDMIDKKNEKFTAHVLVSAGKQGIDFRFSGTVPVQSIPDTDIKVDVKEPYNVQIAQNNEGNKTEGTKKQDIETKVPSQKVESGKQIGKKEAEKPAKKNKPKL